MCRCIYIDFYDILKSFPFLSWPQAHENSKTSAIFLRNNVYLLKILLSNLISILFPKFLELFFTPENTPPKVKNLNHPVVTSFSARAQYISFWLPTGCPNKNCAVALLQQQATMIRFFLGGRPKKFGVLVEALTHILNNLEQRLFQCQGLTFYGRLDFFF